MWLVKAMITESPARLSPRKLVMQMPYPPWDSSPDLLPLEELTLGSIFLESPLFDAESTRLDHLTSQAISLTFHRGHEGLGQVWASVGNMLLVATDLPQEDPNHKALMTNALQIIAHLHHVDALPSTIYTHSHCEDRSVIQKPPTLYLLAYRMMAVLSDFAWKAHDDALRQEAPSVGAKKWYRGHELPSPAREPHIYELGSEVWLELVLWSCVEGGWLSEAGWIATEMAKRQADLKWRAVEWNEIRKPTAPKLNWSARFELDVAKSLMTQVASGVGNAGISGAPPSVELDSRAISSEVILSIMNALGTAFNPSGYLAPHRPGTSQPPLCSSWMHAGRSSTVAHSASRTV